MADQSLIDAAKASIIACNNKDWKAVTESVTPDCVYEEFARIVNCQIDSPLF